MSDQLITVNVINFPDGTTYWFEKNYLTEKEEMEKRIDKWFEDNPTYKGTNVDASISSLRMFRCDYENITADINAVL